MNLLCYSDRNCTWDPMSTFYPLNKYRRINMGSDVVKQDVDEVGLVDGVLDQVVPKVHVVILLAKVDSPMNVGQLTGY